MCNDVVFQIVYIGEHTWTEGSDVSLLRGCSVQEECIVVLLKLSVQAARLRVEC